MSSIPVKIKIEKVNEIYLRVFPDSESVAMDLRDYFTFEPPQVKYKQKVLHGLWDGKIRLYNIANGLLYAGLFKKLYEWCEKRGYEVELDENEIVPDTIDIPDEDIEEFIDSLKIAKRLEDGSYIELTPHDFQVSAIKNAIRTMRHVILSPTASGKSYMVYCVVRWLTECNRNVLILVPTVNLVNQIYSDFVEYSHYNGWDVSANVSKLYANVKPKDTPVLISTWQSINGKMPQSWYKKWNGVIVDEAHRAKSKEFANVLKNMPTTDYRIGLTGTFDDVEVDKLMVEGLLGPAVRYITTSQMIERGISAKMKIKVFQINWPLSVRKKKMDYEQECEFIQNNKLRDLIIMKLVMKAKETSLVLFRSVKNHMLPFSASIGEMNERNGSKKQIYLTYEKISPEEREEIRNKMRKISEDCCLLATYHTLSTGINIETLTNIFFADPMKSKISVLQSIGRMLRKYKDKQAVLYDIADNLTLETKSGSVYYNTTFTHLGARLRYYDQENFPVEIIEIDITEEEYEQFMSKGS